MATLKIYYQNFRGLKTKTKDLRLATLLGDYDVIVGTETWLDDSVYDDELFSNNYYVYRRDRQSTSLAGKGGGGVLIAVCIKYHSKRMFHYESTGEDLWISVNTSTDKAILIGAIYIPPPITVSSLEPIIDNCSDVILSHSGDVIILGDFNLGFIDWNKESSGCCNLTPLNYQCSLGYLLIDFMSLNNLSQFNHVANHKSRILDLVLSNLESIIVDNCINPLCKLDSHHPALSIGFSSYKYHSLRNKQFATYNYKKADYAILKSKLSHIDWVKELSDLDDVDIAVSKFYQLIYDVIQSTIPRTKRRSLKYPHWFTRNLIKLIAERNTIRSRYEIYRNPRDKIELILSNKRVESLMSSCYNTYLKNTEYALIKNPKKFWSYVKSLRGGLSNLPSEMYLDDKVARGSEEICNLFATRFYSIYSPPDNSTQPDLGDCYPQLNLSNVEITERDVEKVLKSIDPNKGAGPDGIPPYFIKKRINI